MNITIKNCLLMVTAAFLTACDRKTAETKPVRKNITETVFATGLLVPENQYNLTAQSDGYIVQLRFDEGDTVKTGDVLAVIDNKVNSINAQSASELSAITKSNLTPGAPALKQAEASIAIAREKFLQDSLQAERYKKLYESNSVSRLELENALLSFKNSRAGLATAIENYDLVKQQARQQHILQESQAAINQVLQQNNQVKAVIGGRVYSMLKQQGDYVRKGETIAVIGSPAQLYARLSVDEANIIKVAPGQKVVIQLNTNKERTYNGIVSEIYPDFDEQTQSFYCRVNFTDQLDFLVSGTQLQANIIVGHKTNVLVIPRNYLMYGDKVLTEDKNEVKVETGFVSNEWVEIVSGLDEHTTIITYQAQ